ncbi:MAG: hypothetical protein V4857_17915 [Pseudomonadota bacterium]
MFEQIHQPLRLAVEWLANQDRYDVAWRGWYALYVDLDPFFRHAEDALSTLERGARGLGAGDGSAPNVDVCNEAFLAVDQLTLAMFRTLFGLVRSHRHAHGTDAKAFVIDSHCHPKSDWMIEWEADCYIGRLSADGRCLQQRLLRMHPAPAARMGMPDLAGLEAFAATDIATPALRAGAAHQGRTSLLAMQDTAGLLRQDLRARCTITDLVP